MRCKKYLSEGDKAKNHTLPIILTLCQQKIPSTGDFFVLIFSVIYFDINNRESQSKPTHLNTQFEYFYNC
jgi:hypothetical protein